MDNSSKDVSDDKDDGDNVTGGDKDENSSNSVKRNSLSADDFPDFDTDSLEVDDWRDVFDEDDDTGVLDATTLSDTAANSSTDDEALGNDSMNSTQLMPPPASLTENSSSSTPTKAAMTSSMPTAFSSIPGIEELVKNRPPLDHSITRRKTAASTVDRRDSAPPTWHSEAADLPHRKAMVQDIAKLLYARKKGKIPARAWLERVPQKAKMLESQLYKNTASLEAYLNRSTLKGRLGKLASAITSHYKQATKSKRGSSRSSASSIASLDSLENVIADSKLRRVSVMSTQSMPTLLNSNNVDKLGENDSHRSARVIGDGSMTFSPNNRRQSDPILHSSRGHKHTIPSLSSPNESSNININNGGMIRNGNESNRHGANLAGMLGDGRSGGIATHQQQFLISIRQQQQELVRRMSGGNTDNTPMMRPISSVADCGMDMLVGNSFPMLDQQAMMQQNALTLSRLRQLNNFQQQQSMNPGCLSLHNISIMQQQQQFQQQQMGLSACSVNSTPMGMNLMGVNMPAVFQGNEVNLNQSMQTMMPNQLAMTGNHGMNNMMDICSMPPPYRMEGSADLQRRSSTGNDPSLNDEASSPLSPGSFDW